MLIGTADPEALAAEAASLDDFATDAVRLDGVETLHLFSEIASEGMEALLPPGLHPTLPPAVTWIVQRVAESPWGSFSWAQTRIECRSGLRPRGFLRAAMIDNCEAAEALARRWGYATRPGRIELARGYDRIRATVRADGETILSLVLRDPAPLGTHDIYIVSNMNLVRSPRGLRLVQVDPDWEIARAERGRPIVESFDAGGWRCAGVRPTHAVSAVLGTGAMTLPRLRYVCRPDALAFYGSERIDG